MAITLTYGNCFLVKYENIMWENHGPDAQIKVIDFGLSKKFGLGEKDEMTSSVGTYYTMAPQVLQGVYTSQADLWSCGVIIYMLLTSRRPFYHKFKRIMIDKIMRAQCAMDGDRWKGISVDAKDLVANLLKLDPKERFNASQALEHRWMTAPPCHDYGQSTDAVNEKVKENLMAYQYQLELKKIALNIIAHRSSAKEINELRKCFNHYDKSGDGIIEVHEFKAGMADANFSDAEIEEMFRSVVSLGWSMFSSFVHVTYLLSTTVAFCY
jgi:calcium-dependent protein kinase